MENSPFCGKGKVGDWKNHLTAEKAERLDRIRGQKSNGYWKASLEWPHRVSFLRYEDMKTDTIAHVKRLAEFMDHPFSLEEESQDEVNKVINLCSFENLSNLDVNMTGKSSPRSNFEVVNKAFFRRGEVADWENYLTAEMVDCWIKSLSRGSRERV
ncbi:flavonol 3-sulfotransferase-like [Vitis riparia]|uniref:flavonol 3-sulfotransferase-like n=1 Tax=Vitis riparia TaxID=96939 RepID=UPI00155A523A|nr:flavonol 3-sulfotransferase-like [Vitis riparia]